MHANFYALRPITAAAANLDLRSRFMALAAQAESAGVYTSAAPLWPIQMEISRREEQLSSYKGGVPAVNATQLNSSAKLGNRAPSQT